MGIRILFFDAEYFKNVISVELAVKIVAFWLFSRNVFKQLTAHNIIVLYFQIFNTQKQILFEISVNVS